MHCRLCHRHHNAQYHRTANHKVVFVFVLGATIAHTSAGRPRFSPKILKMGDWCTGHRDRVQHILHPGDPEAGRDRGRRRAVPLHNLYPWLGLDWAWLFRPHFFCSITAHVRHNLLSAHIFPDAHWCSRSDAVPSDVPSMTVL